MDNIGEGDVDLIKAPIVIDNVSQSDLKKLNSLFTQSFNRGLAS